MQTLFQNSKSNVNAVHTKDSYSPLTFAVTFNLSEVIQLLIHYGANVNEEGRIDNGDEGGPLHQAASNSNTTILKLLIDHQANIDARTAISRWTPLMCAAANGYSEIVQTLIAANADKNLKDYHGKTAQDNAERFGHEEVYLKAVEAGEAERDRYAQGKKEAYARIKAFIQVNVLTGIIHQYAYGILSKDLPKEIPEEA